MNLRMVTTWMLFLTISSCMTDQPIDYKNRSAQFFTHFHFDNVIYHIIHTSLVLCWTIFWQSSILWACSCWIYVMCCCSYWKILRWCDVSVCALSAQSVAHRKPLRMRKTSHKVERTLLISPNRKLALPLHNCWNWAGWGWLYDNSHSWIFGSLIMAMMAWCSMKKSRTAGYVADNRLRSFLLAICSI
jgi:hypothetical protein